MQSSNAILLWPLLAAAWAAGPKAAPGLIVVKCCDVFERLSGDGQRCEAASWPRNQPPNDVPALWPLGVASAPLDPRWLRRWLPPGLAPRRVTAVSLRFRRKLRQPPRALPVREATAWDQRRAVAEGASYWRGRAVLTERATHVRPEPWSSAIVFRGGTTGYANAAYCLDAADPPLGPYALLVGPLCELDDCATKCCPNGQLLAAAGDGDGDSVEPRCEAHQRGFWPVNSSFAASLSDIPVQHREGRPCLLWRPSSVGALRLEPGDAQAAHWLRRRQLDFAFSSWLTCADYERRADGSLGETLFFCCESAVEYHSIPHADPGAECSRADLSALTPKRKGKRCMSAYEEEVLKMQEERHKIQIESDERERNRRNEREEELFEIQKDILLLQKKKLLLEIAEMENVH